MTERPPAPGSRSRERPRLARCSILPIWYCSYRLFAPCIARKEDSMQDKTFEVTRSEKEWRRRLTPEQYNVMRRHGTEAPGSCALNHEKRHGTFACAGCGQPLFASKRKFESGTGWPSFNDPVPGAVET